MMLRMVSKTCKQTSTQIYTAHNHVQSRRFHSHLLSEGLLVNSYLPGLPNLKRSEVKVDELKLSLLHANIYCRTHILYTIYLV
jgi:hypothetical protein